jgi:MFS family permease
MTPTERLWTKDFCLISLINLQMISVFYMLVVVIASYAMNTLGATTSQAGLISGLFVVGSLVARFAAPQLITKLGRKKTLVLSLIGFSLGSLLYLIELNVEFLLLTRFVHGLMLGFANTVLSTMIAQALPPSRRGEGIGYYSLSSTLGSAIGPFLAIYLSINTPFHWIFIAALLFSLLCLALSVLVQIPAAPTPSSDSPNSHQISFWANFIEPKALPIALIVLLSAISYSSVLSFITFYAHQLQLTQAASLFFIFYAVAIICSRPFSGRLMDLKGAHIVMYPALVILSAGLLILSFGKTSLLLLVAALLLGLGFGNVQSIAQAIAVKSSSYERMGLATATFFMAMDIGLGFGPFVLGYLLNFISYAQMYLLAGSISVVALILYYLLLGRPETAAQQDKPKPYSAP